MGTLLATPLVLLLGIGMFVLLLNNLLVDRRPPTVIYVQTDRDADRHNSGCMLPLLVLLVGLYLLWSFGHILFL